MIKLRQRKMFASTTKTTMLIFLLAAFSLEAETITKWKNNALDSNWFKAENWTNGIPKKNTDAIIEGKTSNTPQISAGNVELNSLFIKNNAGLQVTGKAVLKVNDLLELGSGSFLTGKGSGKIIVRKFLDIAQGARFELCGSSKEKPFHLQGSYGNCTLASLNGEIKLKNYKVSGIPYIAFFEVEKSANKNAKGKDLFDETITIGRCGSLPEMSSAGIDAVTHLYFNEDFKGTIQKHHKYKIKVLPYVSFVKLVDLSLKNGGAKSGSGTNSGTIPWEEHPFWKNLDCSKHPEWRQVKKDGTFARPFNSAAYWEGVEAACPNSPGLAGAYIKGIKAMLDEGADGFYLDNTVEGCRKRPCFGPKFGLHKHPDNYSRKEAFQNMTRYVCGEIKKTHPNCIISGGHNKFWEDQIDMGLEIEGYIFQIGKKPRFQDWSEIQKIGLNPETQEQIDKGKHYAVLSYMSSPLLRLRDDSFYAYACARLFRYAWSGNGRIPKYMLRMLYRCKLGRPGKMQEINSVYIRTYENGIVAVNPTKETQTVLFQAPSEFSICDVCTGACASFEKGKLKIEIPSHSGQIYLKRRNLLTNYLLEAQCLAVQTKGNKDLRRELQDKITEALFALKNSNARENESNNLINLSDSLLDICDKIRFSANPKNKFIEAQEKENHPPSASISDSLDICIRKFWMNLHGINISWFSDGKLVPGKKSTLKMKILAQKTPVEFSLSFPETKFLKISPQKTERKVQKEKAAYEEFSIELKDQDISPKVIFISPAIHIKMQGREKAVFYSDFIEFEINHTSFRKSFTTGICDELDLGYDFNLTGEAGKAFNISVNLNCVGGSTKDNDYLNDFSIALRKKGEKNEIILPVFEKETIGSKNISQAKFKKTVAWTPDSPGTYELGFQYKYTDPDHLDKANKTLTTYWLKEPTIKIDKPLYQEGNIP